ncbi:hypothetical protein [Absidia glauca]|uniref:Secreted protein n=1 Tax=Absidia glauca TaxID=4829 RepID=A0A163IR86_ABSGL|nr:hypothetical protein [Absidia glauca]
MCLKLLLLIAFIGMLSLLQAASTGFNGTPLEGIEINDPMTALLLTTNRTVSDCVGKTVQASPTSYKGSSQLSETNVQRLISSCIKDPKAAPPPPLVEAKETKKKDDPFGGTPLEGIEIDDPLVALAMSLNPKVKECVFKAVQQDPEAYKGSSRLNKENFNTLVLSCLKNPNAQPPSPQHPPKEVQTKNDDPFAGTPLEGVRIDDPLTVLALTLNRGTYQCVTDRVKISPDMYKGEGQQKQANITSLIHECLKKQK